MNNSCPLPESPTEMYMMASDLPDADLDRLAAFLRIGSERLRHRWQLTESDGARLYVFGGDFAPTAPAALDFTPTLVRVVDAHASVEPDQQVLVRPIQFEAFVEAMVRAEARWPVAGDAAPPARPRAEAVPGPAPNAEAALALARALDAGAPVRLRRWPRAHLLNQSRYGLRMASFLTARHLSVTELAELSHVDRQECEQFITLLADAGLLIANAPPDAARPAPAAPATPATPAIPGTPAVAAAPAEQAKASDDRRSLLGLLRRKLGLVLKGR